MGAVVLRATQSSFERVLSCEQEENVRRKEHAAKRKAVETGTLDAGAAGAAKRQRLWWEEEIAHGRRGGEGGAALAEDEVNDAEYYKAEARRPDPPGSSPASRRAPFSASRRKAQVAACRV